MTLLMPAVPPVLLDMPIGNYGISYDISTQATEDDLPNGWNSRRGSTHRSLQRRLLRAGFVRHQNSDYRIENAQPEHVWTTMLQLRLIPPPGKFESTVLGLKMYRLEDESDVTARVWQGGAFSPALRDPTPAALVPAGILDPAPVIPGPDFVRPVYTRPSAMADDPNNYRT